MNTFTFSEAPHCVVQLLSGVQLFAPPLTAACTPGFPILHYLPEFAQTHVHWTLSNHLILCHSLLLLPSIFPTIRVFFNKLALRTRWPKYWSFSFSISHSNKSSGLISFRVDCLILQSKGLLTESSPTPQFKSINSLVLNFLYGPTRTSMHDYWKTQSFD